MKKKETTLEAIIEEKVFIYLSIRQKLRQLIETRRQQFAGIFFMFLQSRGPSGLITEAESL